MLKLYKISKTALIIYTVLLMNLALIPSLFAQGTGGIRGTVTDAATDEPLIGANIVIKNSGLGAATDADGNFIIRHIPEGNQQLVVSYIGYKSSTLNVSITTGRILEQNVSLEAQGITGDTIIVTAQAEGQLSAINQQLTSNTIASVVSKSRIKEMPDVNAAESIGRLPGVAINRSGGEATKVSIRGLSPKYNLVTVNGVRLPSSGGNDIDFDRNFVDAGSNERSVDLSLISSNMLDGIVLKKALTADMDGDAIGGTIDLKLKEAPEKMQFNLSAQGGYNDLLDYYGNYNFEGNISSRFFNNKLGVIASLNTDKYDRTADKLEADYRELLNTTEIVAGRVVLSENNLTRKRAGGSVLLDYKIPDGKIIGNMFYSHLSWDGLNRINNYTPQFTAESNRYYNDFEERGGNTSMLTGALNFEKDFGWSSFDIGVSRTTSSTKAPDERTWRFTQDAAVWEGTDFEAGTPLRLIIDSSNVDANQTSLAEVWKWDTEREENETALLFNIKTNLDISKNINGYIKVGGKFRWLDRFNDVEARGRHGIDYGGPTGNEMIHSLDLAMPEWKIAEYLEFYQTFPITIFLDDYSRSNFLGGKYPLGMTADMSMLNTITKVLDDSGHVLRYSIPSLGSDYDGIERYQAGYIMGEFKLWKYFTFIPGIRYEEAYTKYHGWRFRETTPNNIQGEPSELTQLEAVRTDEFWLPMVHLVIEPLDWLKIRLARTKTITRPDFLAITPSARITSGQNYIRANNSKLRPSYAVNYDASVSFYENNIGLLTISGFYKDVTDLILQTKFRSTQTGVQLPEGANIPDSWRGTGPETDLYINNPYLTIYKGFEIEWQTHFWYLPSFLNGLVLNVNYTRIFSQTHKWIPKVVRDRMINPPPFVQWSYKVVDSSSAQRMPDQPSHIANITLGYDLGGFSARLSYLYQTDKVDYLDNNKLLNAFTGAYERWDLTLQQKLAWGLMAFANFTNMSNTPDESFRGDKYRSLDYLEYYGFTLDLGVRYTFQ